MGVLFERSEFRPFSNDGHSQRNGNFGRPPFTMPKRFARNQRFRLSSYLNSFFFGGAKKNEYSRVRGTRPGILVAQKEKVNSIGKRQAYRTRKGLKGSALIQNFSQATASCSEGRIHMQNGKESLMNILMKCYGNPRSCDSGETQKMMMAEILPEMTAKQVHDLAVRIRKQYTLS